MNIKHLFATVGAITLTATPVLARSAHWVYMGKASTGESIHVYRKLATVYYPKVRFSYRIGNETIGATAYCNENRWYASGYGTYSPSSRATQNMMDFVCGR